MTNAILVIDMLRGFMEEGHPLCCGNSARGIIPAVQELLERELSKGSRVFFICDNHSPNDAEFEIFPPHCIAGSQEAELIPELSEFPGETIFKNRYSGFFETELDCKLNQLDPQKIIVCGVCTDICVMHTVSDARNRGFAVEVPADCVASFDRNAHQFALGHMERVLGTTIVTSTSKKAPSPKFEAPQSVQTGQTADVYFLRAREILEKEGLDPVVTMEVFSRRSGVLCGMHEVLELLSQVLPEDNREVWALSEGEFFDAKEVVLRITARFQSYVVYETAYLGMLAHASGWATAARQCVTAARGIPVLSFGARHVHPLVVGTMEYAAIIGGCSGCASTAGANLAGLRPIGTIPHALILVMGDTAQATMAFDRNMPEDLQRVALVDTYRDEVEESIIVAETMGGRLHAIRLDTPLERGGVTTSLVKEARARLDLAGFRDVKIFVSGGLNPERIEHFLQEGASIDTFAVGSYISGARPIDFTADVHEIDGKPVAKRGRIPGITPNPRLTRVL